MQFLAEGLGKTVGESLQHYYAVVIGLFLEFGNDLFLLKAGRDCEHTYVVLNT